MSAGSQAPVKQPRKRPTKFELEQRRKTTRELVSLQTNRRDIAEVLMSKPYFLGVGQAYKEIDAAYRDIEEDFRKSGAVPRLRAVAIQTYSNLYQRCLREKRFTDAIRVFDKLCLLQGLYPAATHQVVVAGEVQVNDGRTTAQLRGELQALLAQRDAMLSGAGSQGTNGSGGQPH